jgi:hypothetical protein
MNSVVYYYKLVMKNGKEYSIQSKIRDIPKFAELCFNSNQVTDFILKDEIVEGGVKYNTVLLRTTDISSIEYSIELESK